jgi:4-alpha-glucanotransferase
LNDTGNESSPYCAISANALNPIYLGLIRLKGISDYPDLQKQISELQTLDKQQRIDYSAVRNLKEKLLKDYFQTQQASLPSLAEYQRFKTFNPWVFGYALFKALKIKRNWQSWEKWPIPIKDPDLNQIEIDPQLREETELHIFVQYLCFQQMEEVKQFATTNQVFLKGDIPILINKESADVWLNRKLFLMQYEAGAPPDMYAKKGQKWGFPLYDWSAMQNEFYQWWIERLQVASLFYHIYRIDHIVGFYRIWGIPKGLKPAEGHFIPEDVSAWIPQGNAIMRMMLNNCPMLPIGEDLGTIPPEVRVHLRDLGICGTKVMRWERRWLKDKGFINPLDYESESMTTVSTHDSETLQQWWEKHPDEARLFCQSLGWKYTPDLSDNIRLNILKISHNSNSLFHINLLQEYLALVPGMTWPKVEDERINIPGTVSETNWTYRFKPSVEEIVGNEPLKLVMKKVLYFTNRSFIDSSL